MSITEAVKPRRKPARATAETVASSDAVTPPIDATQGDTIAGDPLISVVIRTGMRSVRGVPTRVALPVFNVLIGGVLVAITSTEVTKPVMGVREVLPQEVPLLMAAVARERGDETQPQFVPQPRFA